MNELDLLERFRDDVPEASTDAWLRAQAAIAAAQDEESTGPEPSSIRKGSRRRATVAVAGVVFAVAAIVVALLFTAPRRDRRPLDRLTVPESRLRRAMELSALVLLTLSPPTATRFFTRSRQQRSRAKRP